MLQLKGIDRFQQLYVVCKRLSLDSEIQISWKWKKEKVVPGKCLQNGAVVYTNIRQHRPSIKKCYETKKDMTYC